jgi:hypothetical protein
MFRFALSIVCLVPVCCYGSTIGASSYCRVTQDGIVIADNSFPTLLPEGTGACPYLTLDHDVSLAFGAYVGTADGGGQAIFYGLTAGQQIGVILSDELLNHDYTFDIGQNATLQETHFLSVERPDGVLADSARLRPLETGPDGGWRGDPDSGESSCNPPSDTVCQPGQVRIRIDAPSSIQYGTPFEVTVTADMSGLRLHGPETYGGWNQFDGYRVVYTLQDFVVDVEPVPEPSTELLALVGLVIMGLRACCRRSPARST